MKLYQKNLYNSVFIGLVESSGASYIGVSFPESKYYDVYKASSGTTISILTACNGGLCYGHGLSEINNWYGDRTDFVSTGSPWFIRGGDYGDGSEGGIFFFDGSWGSSSFSYCFRSVLSPIGA